MKKKDISYTFRTGKTRRLSDLFITIPDGSGGYSFTKAYSIFKVFMSVTTYAPEKYLRPVDFKDGILYIYSNNSVWSDTLKYEKFNIIKRINDKLKNNILKDIKLVTKSEYQAASAARVINIDKDKPEVNQDIIIDKSEKEGLEKECRQIADDELRNCLLSLRESHLKMIKAKKIAGYHKCSQCDSLVEKDKKICFSCQRKKREKNLKKIRDFLDAMPWAIYKDAYNALGCSSDDFNSQNQAMIKSIMSDFDAKRDINSIKLDTIMMLIKKIEPQEINDEIKRKFLIEYRYDFNDSYIFEMMKNKKL